MSAKTTSLLRPFNFAIALALAFLSLIAKRNWPRDGLVGSSEMSPSQASYRLSDVRKRWTVDDDCFLQGFLRVNESAAIASCGGYGRSRLAVFSGFDHDALHSTTMYQAPETYFLEGCTLAGPDRLLVLTWRERKILELDLISMKIIREVIYPHEGWGITYDSVTNRIWTSDGTSILRRVDPVTLSVISECSVMLSHDGVRRLAVTYINELEYKEGLVYANIYMEASVVDFLPNYIVGINPESCFVERIIPLFGLGKPKSPGSVMNGIAEGFKPNSLLISGKNWDTVYEVQIGEETSKFASEWSAFNITRFIAAKLKFR